MKKLFLINFLLAISTSMGMTLLPIVATESLGISLFVLGIIEGVTEFFSNVLRLINGNLFDRITNKKFLFITSVGAAFFSKSLLLVFLNKYSILASKMIERLANGAFASPRDAYVTTNAKRKGLTLGMLSSSKTLGCVIGTFIVSLSVVFFGSVTNNIFLLILITCTITLIAMIISCYIKSPVESKKEVFDFKNVKQLLIELFPIYSISFVFFLARFNDSVLMMFLKSQGFPEWFYLSTISFFNIAMLISSPILGILIDNNYKNIVLFGTIISLILFNMIFYNINSFPWTFACLGLIFWGVQRTGAQIIFSYLVTQKILKTLNGTSIGILAIINAFGNLISSSISGYFMQDSFFDVFIVTGLIASTALVLAMIYAIKISKS
jgi:MFS family permease